MNRNLTIKIKRQSSISDWILCVIFGLLLLQTPLSSAASAFKYIDECFALFGSILFVIRVIRLGKVVLTKTQMCIITGLMVFCLVGLLANGLFEYQSLSYVLIDLFTNLKFFLSIYTGYWLFLRYGWERSAGTYLHCAKFSVVILFCMLIADYLLEIFPGGLRYGIRSEQLFFGHETYLAAAMVYLLMILMMFYEKNNNMYIVGALIILCATLRAKALAGSALFCLEYLFFLRCKKKLRSWHIVLAVLMVLIIGWDQILFYFVELGDESARSALMKNAFVIAEEYFPIGTGFGTYASNAAVEHYSKVYIKYGMSNVYGLSANFSSFSSDTFWPIILGQTGIIGTICYVYVLVRIFGMILKSRQINVNAYAAGIFAMGYLLISSTSESAFCNSLSIPLAIMLGGIFALEKENTVLSNSVQVRCVHE